MGDSISGFAFPPDLPLFSDKKINSEFYEDFQDLSPSHLTANPFLEIRVYVTAMCNPARINLTEDPRETAYFSTNRFITPGLSHPDIIFPFHTFL